MSNEKRIGEQYFFNLATPSFDVIQEIASNHNRYKFYYNKSSKKIRLYNEDDK